jgi:hypothetical protein
MAKQNLDGHRPGWWDKHPESRARAEAELREKLSAAKDMVIHKPKNNIWGAAFNATASTLGLVLITTGGAGVLSMNPPEVRLAHVCFSLGFAIIAIRVVFWVVQNLHGSADQRALLVGVVWLLLGVACFYCINFASSRSPVTLDLKFDSITTTLGDPKDREFALTWDKKPWNEHDYSDVRLRISAPATKILNLDLHLRLIGEHDAEGSFYGISAIGQITDIPGIQFIPPQLPELDIPMRGSDHEDYIAPINFGKGLTGLPTTSIRIVIPQLLDGQHLTLVIGTSYDDAVKGRSSKVPPYIEVSGTGDALIDGSTRQGFIRQEPIPIKNRIDSITVH